MSWGATVVGTIAVKEALDDIEVKWGNDVVYIVGTRVIYAVHQELGTSNMEAQPFLFPAAREVMRELDAIAAGKNSQEDIIKAAALEIERRAAQKAPVDTGNLQASIVAAPAGDWMGEAADAPLDPSTIR